MDNLTHSFVGLAAAKSGLERLSPYATTVCLLSANAPDADFVALFFGDRWTLLQHHRGITHSILGTLILALMVPALIFGIEKSISALRKRSSRIRFRGLLIASTITAITHPLLDWTNSYGVRPWLPWSSKWIYGDLVFIVDPYIWLVLGGAGFLLSSERWPRVVFWAVFGAAVTALVMLASVLRAPDAAALGMARKIWLIGIGSLILLRAFRVPNRFGRKVAFAAFAFLVIYWGGLWWAHKAAHENALRDANQIATGRGERLVRVATMPMLADPLRWQTVSETDQAFYRFFSESKEASTAATLQRFPKPTDRDMQIISRAEADRRAQILLDFARFPIAQVAGDDCIGTTLVQFADLRYTEPGAARGNFALTVPVECPAP
jgi:inner membrane protein